MEREASVSRRTRETDIQVELRLDGSVAAAGCLVEDLSTTSWSDPQPDPTTGQGLYYLLRGQNVCGDGSYGTGNSGERTPSAACP